MEKETIEEAVELVEKAKKPGVFNILNVLKDRGYPTDKVSVILEEDKAYRAAVIKDTIDSLMNSNKKEINKDVESLQKELDSIVEEINSSRYVFNITGISEGSREELLKKATEKFPVEYDVTKNPFTGKEEKEEKASPERDEYFTDLLWVSSIQSIESPDGSIQEGIDIDLVKEMRDMLPLTANAAITQAIEKIRVSTGMFIMSTDEDFLVKP